VAEAQLSLAHYLVESGDDPTTALARAHDYVKRAEAGLFESSIVWYYRLVAANTLAAFELRQGRVPVAAIAAGNDALKEGLRRSPDSPAIYVEAARLALTEAAWATRAGRSAPSILDRALAHAEHAIELDAQLAKARFTAAEVCVQIATARPSRAI